MTDIANRIRAEAQMVTHPKHKQVLLDALDEIERLQAITVGASVGAEPHCQKERVMKAEEIMFADIERELRHAQAKFPDSVLSLAALMEEVGELAQAMLKARAGKWPKDRVYDEAVQVAVMAMRVALEGDRSFDLVSYSEPA